MNHRINHRVRKDTQRAFRLAEQDKGRHMYWFFLNKEESLVYYHLWDIARDWERNNQHMLHTMRRWNPTSETGIFVLGELIISEASWEYIKLKYEPSPE